MVSKLDQRVATWGSIITAALAVGAVIFSSGDAAQRLANHDKRLDVIEPAITDLRVSQAVLMAQMNDIQATVHKIDGSPVPEPLRVRIGAISGSGSQSSRP